MWLALLAFVAAYDGQFKEAQAREDAQDDAGAIAIWEAAVRESPTAALPRVELGRLLLKSGEQVALATFHLEIACSLSPGNPRAHYLYALAAEERKDVAQARRSLETALMLRDDYDEARLRLAGLLFAEGDFSGAAEAYRRFVDRHPDDTGARLQLALASERSGKVDAAERLLRSLEKEPTTRGLARRRLAELLERHGRVAEAQKLRAKDAPPRRLRELRPSSR
jgi:Flp pilus assembly protein TadD